MPDLKNAQATEGSRPLKPAQKPLGLPLPDTWPARAKKALSPRSLFAVSLYLCVCYLIIQAIVKGAGSSGYFWQWYRVDRVFFQGENGTLWGSPLIQGLGMTMRIGGISLICALGIAIITTALRLGGGPVAWSLAVGYVQLIRNTPLLVQILFMYFVIAPGIGIQAEPSAIIALSLFEGAYMSEILRGGVLTVPSGQAEAGLSLGLTSFQVAKSIVMPQAVRSSMPPLLNECITLIKNTSMASVISVAELTFKGKIAVSSTFMSLEIWLTVAAIYLILSLFLTALAWLLSLWLNRGWANAASTV